VKGLFAGAALVVIAILVALAFELVMGSRLSISAFGLSFLYGTDWDPIHSVFGSLQFIYGTLFTSALALLIGVPVSLGVAIFLSERAKGLRIFGYTLGTLIELLAAVPSVIYGLWGLFVLVPFIRTYIETPLHASFGYIPLFAGAPSGLDYLSAGVVLAIMIIPTISAISRDVLNAVPNSQREAMYSLGATQWEVTRRAVIPYARSGIFGATILGLGRAVGETMAVVMVVGNTPTITADLFSGGYTLSGLIANQFTESTTALWTSAVVEIGLVLFGLALTINVLARFLIWRMTKGTKYRV
jgi:phosphate transport system permease protein